MTLIEFIQNNLPADLDPVIIAVALAIIFLVCYDFYHLLFSAILSWFQKK